MQLQYRPALAAHTWAQGARQPTDTARSALSGFGGERSPRDWEMPLPFLSRRQEPRQEPVLSRLTLYT